MNDPEPHVEEELFDAARRIADAAARRGFLDRACTGDEALRRRIDDLLAAGFQADRFFEEVEASLSFSGSLVPLVKEASIAAALPGEEPIGTRIGRYKLLQKIGEGGCGVVYLAEQQEPVRRRVALKIIKLGMETMSVIARFEAERQALAMMDHPNIARVFDAGATDRGSPYFVMELVRGVRLTDYCDQNQLNCRERLDLFVQVCHAIQHAHQKGIIHGDIKPSNIMVSLHDGVPVPKVIDFGISKATEARLTDQALFNAEAQPIGTPAYMSPEQAMKGGVDIDTRSDIYSLGVLLYELLTGRTPFDAKALVRSGFGEMRRTLCECEPPRPSLRLTALDPAELHRTAENRRVAPRGLITVLRHDLDWVAMKCLEKDRGRRYETANGLAMDIQRHLGNEPVLARPPTRLYRFQKLVRRNRGLFAAVGAVATALVMGLAVSTWLFLKEREARQRAVAAEQQQGHLRLEAEGREQITQVALLVTQERFDEADHILKEVGLFKPTVEGAAVLRAVGEWHALHARWRPGAERLAMLLRVNQLDGMDGVTLDHLRCAAALVELGDTAAYERFRDEAIARFAASPGPFADRIVKASLVLPAGAQTIAAMNPLAVTMAKSLAEAEAAGDGFMAAWRSMSQALWEYRRGNFAEAAERCRRCLAYRDFTNAPRTATARVILAMSHQRLGRADEARAELAMGRELVETKLKRRIDRGTPMQGFWFDWAFARALLKEAAALIETPPVGP